MNLSRHLKILAVFLAILGLGLTGYQIFVLDTPLSESKLTEMWTVDARVSFDLPGAKPVDLQFHLPPRGQGWEISNELFIANNYGQSIFDSGENRLVQWTARRASGRQTIFYRFNLIKAAAAQEAPGETWRPAIPVEGTEKIAVDALIEEIRQKSADTSSFISTAVNKVSDDQDSNILLLLGTDKSQENRIRLLEVLLSQAHIPVQPAHALRLDENGAAEPELWARSYIEVSSRQEAGWYYFNLETVSLGLPPDRLLWWVGAEPLIKSASGVKPRVDFSLSKNELTARSLEKISEGNDFSLYSLPLSTQFAYQLMLMIPFGVFIILVIRNIVGVETLGTFTPVLIALAFRETGLVFGAVFFTVIISMGLLLRSYLEQLKLQMLPRLSVVLTSVILLIIALSMLCHKLGFDKGLAITLFPMVILTMAIERLSITWEERGGAYAFRVGVGTILSASCVYLILNIQALSYFVFTFPGILFLVMAVMLGLGRYSGYRLMELFRFKALINKG